MELDLGARKQSDWLPSLLSLTSLFIEKNKTKQKTKNKKQKNKTLKILPHGAWAKRKGKRYYRR
jgi:hypothetical protein